MRFCKKGFTIIEIIVALSILSIVVTGIMRAYIYMLNTNEGLAQNLNFQNYSQYVSSLIDAVDVTSQQISEPFYLKFTDSNTIVASTGATNKMDDLNFFAFRDSKYGHEFIFVGTGVIDSTVYNIYTVETFGPNNQTQKAYVTK